MITRRADLACEACRAGEDRGCRVWLEAHERWSYDIRSGIQTLRRLVALATWSRILVSSTDEPTRRSRICAL